MSVDELRLQDTKGLCEFKCPPAVAQLVERQTVEYVVICWSLVRFRAAGRVT